MKYYSEITKKLYETNEELVKAESDYNLALKEKEDKLSLKKKEAQEVLDAYKEINKVYKEYQEKLKAVEDVYLKKRSEFIKKYGNWHMSYSDVNGVETYSLTDVFDSVSNLFKTFFE